MKKSSLILSLLLLSVTLMGCGEKHIDEAAETVIQKSWEKLADKNATFDTGEIEAEGRVKLDFEGSTADLQGKVGVIYDRQQKDNESNAITIDLSGKGDVEGLSGDVTIKGELRMMEEKLYFLLDKLNISTDDPQAGMIAQLVETAIKGKWYFYDLPTDELMDDAGNIISSENFTGEKAAEVAKKYNFFDLKEELGYRHYSLAINAEKLKAYVTAVSEVNQNPLEAEDLDAINTLLASLNYTIEVEINNDYDITNLKADLTAKDPEKGDQVELAFEGEFEDKSSSGSLQVKTSGDVPGSLSLDFETNHELGKVVTITAPPDAEKFDPAGMLGLGAMGAMPEMDAMPN